ncbi:hypothetical protein [Clostridium sp. MCC353]|uniref:hypothetical protein n=1 Tax=Clostridium sp. MCC353 TaxID=2592646 RepID=UPI001C0268FA|nr:hypothetical protein [Clostridium sp. MCC353]
MCKAIEDMRAEERREVSIDITLHMLKDGVLAIEKIAEYSGLTVDEVKALASQKTA